MHLNELQNFIVGADFRLVHYLPSVIAAATMIYAIREIGDEDAVEYEDQLMIVLRTSKV